MDEKQLDPKEFIEKTIVGIATYPHQVQVDIFNEIRHALLAIRKQQDESFACEIEARQADHKSQIAGTEKITAAL